ncbi:hypothetical protein MUN89_18950 [Halobacillus salinarum]|uniref:Uncharacterized protein n=1 Tax=Halobacillus salinarum TaxID=2932257 RepID=A0ABY4EIK4_9BACI|nr:hypothetical protein [Halobacillus salinarum]UOQ43921.1 hypothetical protein MUN89_18950 [Halobacillus salinarum]
MKQTMIPLILLLSFSWVLAGFSNPDQHHKAMWVEKSEWNKETDNLLSKAKSNDIDVLYLKANTDIPADQYQQFIQKASNNGIAVHALNGEPSWALKENQGKIKSFIQWVKDYNQSAAKNEKFKGVHFKIQPQYLSEWYSNAKDVRKQWKNNVTFINEQTADSSLEVSASIPFWLDNTPTPGNSDVPFSTWLIKHFDHTAILAYRDTLEGDNGIVTLVKDELNAADKAGKQIMVGVTLKDTGDDYTTFYEEGVDDMDMHLSLIDEYLGKWSSYVGKAIDNFKSYQVKAAEKETPSAESEDTKKRGTYIWHADTLISEQDSIIEFAKEKNINMLYTRLDLTQPFSAYQDFVEKATKAGIEVHAMGGHPTWALEEGKPHIEKLVNYVKDYNSQSADSQKFTGIHLDIEPYVNPQWTSNEQEVLKSWMKNITMFEEETNKANLESSMDLAMWFDDTKTPGHPDTPFNKWVIETVDHASVMAFRDFAEGSGGIVDMAEDEVKYADELGKDIIISVEMKDVQNKDITFHDEGKEKMKKQLHTVEDNLSKYSSYNGYSIHAYKYWKSAKE